MRGWICGSSRTKITKNSKKKSLFVYISIATRQYTAEAPHTHNSKCSFLIPISHHIVSLHFFLFYYLILHPSRRKRRKKSERQRKYPTLEVVVCVATWWMYLGPTIKKIFFFVFFIFFLEI